MPLTTIQTGSKAWIKMILGKSIGKNENVKRFKYNQLLKNEYSKTGLVFDLAYLEALKPDGNLQTFKYSGLNYLSLYSGYTNDGEHLNENGRRWVAEKLVLYLISICKNNH